MKSGIIRNIIGSFFIFIGFVGIFASDFLAGIFIILFGVSLLPIFYEKTNFKKYKYIQVILPIILIIIAIAVMPKTATETSANTTNEVFSNVIEENNIIEITKLHFTEANIEIDIKEIKDILIEVTPDKANIENLNFYSSNEQIAILEKSKIENNENTLIIKVKPINEGICEVYAKSENGIESNKVIVKIVDNERIEREKKEAEEKAQKEAQEQKAKQQENEKQSQSQQSTTTQKSSQTANNSSNSETSRTVYRTPTGKRYHYDPDCGGKNSYSTTLDTAKSAGLTPCQKCAK